MELLIVRSVQPRQLVARLDGFSGVVEGAEEVVGAEHVADPHYIAIVGSTEGIVVP